MGLHAVMRGRRVRTTVPELLEHQAPDLAQRSLTARRPNQSRVADLRYVPTRRGFVHVAFVPDAFWRRNVGLRASTCLLSKVALDALEPALNSRDADSPLVHHSDRGVQYMSIRYAVGFRS